MVESRMSSAMILPVLIAALVGYLLGALPFGYLVARARGVDIFKAGSGNPGATNVKRVLGSKAGNTVYVLDAVKGAVAAGWPLVWRLVLRPEDHSVGSVAYAASLLGVVGLAAAVIGHSFSCFTRFKGGKGVATASGGLLVLMPLPGLIAIFVWIITFVASRYVSLASLLATLAVPTAAWSLGLPLALKLMATGLSALVVVRHYPNIRRLLAGTEHRWTRRS
jgi:acyl phosphate:glycerol-3-phosphate acyltransferase